MSKAEARALEAYPKVNLEFLRTGHDYHVYRRQGFIAGYEQAEKDLELTIDDVREIIHIYEVTAGLLGDELTDENAKWILDEYNRRKRL